jgi:sporulation protein YlmC with PRC-barrel domain
MTAALIRPTLLTSVALAALVGLTALPGAPVWAAAPAMGQVESMSTNQNAALDAIARANIAMQHRDLTKALDQIERAEVALLNLDELHRDPRLTDALRHVEAARAALNANDSGTAEQQLAAVSQDLNVAFVSAMPGGTSGPMAASPAVGAVVYDPNGTEVGTVVSLVFDPNDQVQRVVIGVGDYLGSGEKYVAVPRTEINYENNRLTLAENKDQLRQADNYWDAGSTYSGSSMPPQK